MRRALQQLLETPVDADNTVARAVLQSVLGPREMDFSKKVLDFAENLHLRPLVNGAVAPVVWENEEMPHCKSVLEVIENEGKEVLLEWMGAYFSLICCVLCIQNVLHVVSFHRKLIACQPEIAYHFANCSPQTGNCTHEASVVLPFLQTGGG